MVILVSISKRSFFAFSICSLIVLISSTNTAISICCSLSFFSRYILAFLACLFNGDTCFSSSMIISLQRSILSLVRCSFAKDSSFLFLYFATPAASSKIALRSIGLASAKLVILPCEIILKESFPKPLSNIRSIISFKRTGLRLIRY